MDEAAHAQGPNIPKVFILNPTNDTTVRPFMYVQVVEKGDCFIITSKLIEFHNSEKDSNP